MADKTEYIGAGFFLRLAVLVQDLLILVLILKLVGTGIDIDENNVSISISTEGIVVVLVYYFLTDWLLQGSIGKRLLKLGTFDECGNRLTAAKSALRLLMRVATLISLLLGYLTILLRQDKRALHDFMSDTYVYKIQEHNKSVK